MPAKPLTYADRLTCQVCGRGILTRNKRIVSHGFTRPWMRLGSGAQTADCPGTRKLPFEIDKRILGVTIRQLHEAAARIEASCEQILVKPFAVPIDRIGRGHKREWSEPGDKHYDHHRDRWLQRSRADRAALLHEIEIQQCRYDAWKLVKMHA